MLRPRDSLGAHQKHRLDRGPAHDVDQVIEGILGIFDQVQDWQQRLAVLSEHRGHLGGVECVRIVGPIVDLVAFERRGWLLAPRV
jgi:hypothetical protein